MNRFVDYAKLSTGIVFGLMVCAPAVAGPKDPFFGAGTKPAFQGAASNSTDPAAPTIVQPKNGKAHDPTKFYIVKVTCTALVNSASQISNGLLIKESQFVSHSLWLADRDSTLDGSVPQNPAKLINVFSFDKNAAGQILNFQNSACSDTFLVSGRASKLTVSFSVTDTKELGPLGAIVFAAAKLVTGIVPLFLGGPLASTVANSAKEVGTAQDPLTAIIAAMNSSPTKVAHAIDLQSGGTTTIGTKYSSVTLDVTQVNDIAEQITKDNVLRVSFNNTLTALSTSYLTGITDTNIRDKCASFSNVLLENYTFQKKDLSFIEGFFAQSAFPGNVPKRLTCIGNRSNAQDILDYQFYYNVTTGAITAITSNDIANYFPSDVFNAVPIDSSIAGPYVERLTGLLAAYAQSATKEKARGVLSTWAGSNMIEVNDATAVYWLDSPANIAITAFADVLVTNKFVRFGCFYLKPTITAGAFDAIFLALPAEKPAGAKTEVKDLLGINLVIKPSGLKTPTDRVTRMDLTTYGPALVEASSKNPQCNINVAAPAAAVAATGPQQQPAGDPGPAPKPAK